MLLAWWHAPTPACSQRSLKHSKQKQAYPTAACSAHQRTCASSSLAAVIQMEASVGTAWRALLSTTRALA